MRSRQAVCGAPGTLRHPVHERAARQVLSLLREIGVRGDALAVLRGPGTRRSPLFGEIARAARDRGANVLTGASPSGGEGVPFGGLRALLVPVMPRLKEIDGSRSGALKVAFELAPGRPPEPFRVAFAALALLGAAAQDGPIALVVDDAHRLDRATADVLCVVARWLRPRDPIVVFLGGRAGRTAVLAGAGLDQLKLGTFGSGPPWPDGGATVAHRRPEPAHHHRSARRSRPKPPFHSRG